MTDEIIIDGVDVSGCKHFENADQEMCCELTCCGGCRGINCYYKQLKAKEQECEELKIYIESNEQQVKEVETLVMDNDRLINELDQLKAENEELKETANKLLDERNKYLDNWGINLIYKQTLTEIKEIANSDNHYFSDGTILRYEVVNKILQKINKCEVEECLEK